MYVALIYISNPVTSEASQVRLQFDEARFDATMWGNSFADVDALVQQMRASAAVSPPKTLNAGADVAL